MIQIFSPLHIFMDQSLKPFLKFFPRLILLQAADLLRFEIAVGDLDGNGIYIFVIRTVHIRIAQCLRQMQRKRLFQLMNVQIDTLDLIDRNSGDCLNDTVCPAFYQNPVIFLLHRMLHRHLSVVIRALTFLDLPVHAASRLHGVLFRRGGSAVIYISAPHDKLHKVSHGNADDSSISVHENSSCFLWNGSLRITK